MHLRMLMWHLVAASLLLGQVGCRARACRRRRGTGARVPGSRVGGIQGSPTRRRAVRRRAGAQADRTLTGARRTEATAQNGAHSGCRAVRVRPAAGCVCGRIHEARDSPGTRTEKPRTERIG